MFENHGEYIWLSPVESYLTNADFAHPSVYRLHFRSAGSEPYTTTKALLRSPNSLCTANPIRSSSDASISPIDFRTGSSLRMKNETETGSEPAIHAPLLSSRVAPIACILSDISRSASAGLYPNSKAASRPMTVRYSGS